MVNYKSIILLALLLVIAVDESFAQENPSDKEVCTNYTDKMITDLSEDYGRNFQKFKIEKDSFGILKKVMFIELPAIVRLSAGLIHGIYTLHPYKDCELKTEGSTIRVGVHLESGVVTITANITVTLLPEGPGLTVRFQLTIAKVRFLVETTCDADTGKNCKLEKFEIVSTAVIKIDIGGLKTFGWALDLITSPIQNIVKISFTSFMEHTVKEHVKVWVEKNTIPISGSEETTEPAEQDR